MLKPTPEMKAYKRKVWIVIGVVALIIAWQPVEWITLQIHAQSLWRGQPVESIEREMDRTSFNMYAVEKSGPNRRNWFKPYWFLGWRDVEVDVVVDDGIVTSVRTGSRF